jgi:hypothetical protein
MSFRLCAVMLVLLTLAGIITGCGPSGDEISVSTGKEFILPVGKAAVVSGEKLSIQFTSVEADSRCPKGVVCIQAGEARCLLQMTLQGSASTVTFIDRGGIDGYSHADFAQYKFAFKVTPYPEAGRTTAAGDYQLVMTVNK